MIKNALFIFTPHQTEELCSDEENKVKMMFVACYSSNGCTGHKKQQRRTRVFTEHIK